MLSFDLPAIFTIKCSDSVSFSFLFPCFLFYLLRTKLASFQLKEIVVFLNLCKCFVCVFISLRDCEQVRITTTSEYCMQLIV